MWFLYSFLGALVVLVILFFGFTIQKTSGGSGNKKTNKTIPFRKRNWSWLWWIVVIILVILGALWGYQYYKKFTTTPKNQPITAIQQVQWQLCWEKKPEQEGKTRMRANCTPAQIERKDDILVVKYNLSVGGYGTIICSLASGAYSGIWRDVWGSGNIYLRFTSETSAFGWVDDGAGTEKIPTSLSK